MYLGVLVDKLYYWPALIALPVLCLLKHCPCVSLPNQRPLLNRTSVSISNVELELKLLCCYIFRELPGSVILDSSLVWACHSGWGWAWCPFPQTIQKHGNSRTKIDCDPTGQACISLCCWKSSALQFCLVLTQEQANAFFIPRSNIWLWVLLYTSEGAKENVNILLLAV